ncbi:unnamed protein product [Pleuronectes platessa]|uniref:Uncharacterized protein n=1 Tax=Pleuronectes platessa TaxID=8262 RepID=A0A9N7UCS0_PLEPL|nr:unnamed protein product [Pleuronectes platessa]
MTAIKRGRKSEMGGSGADGLPRNPDKECQSKTEVMKSACQQKLPASQADWTGVSVLGQPAAPEPQWNIPDHISTD